MPLGLGRGVSRGRPPTAGWPRGGELVHGPADGVVTVEEDGSQAGDKKQAAESQLRQHFHRTGFRGFFRLIWCVSPAGGRLECAAGGAIQGSEGQSASDVGGTGPVGRLLGRGIRVGVEPAHTSRLRPTKCQSATGRTGRVDFRMACSLRSFVGGVSP